VHGANRLGGNSLMETITFGRRAGRAAGERVLNEGDLNARIEAGVVADEERRLLALLRSDSGERPGVIREDLAKSMYDKAGVFRTEETLQEARAKVHELRERARRLHLQDHGNLFNSDLVQALELYALLECADCLVTGALARQESRGAHSRLDFPDRDDDRWMKHTLATYDDGEVRLDYKPVTVTRFEPVVRSY